MTTAIAIALNFALFGAPVQAAQPASRVTPTTTIPTSARCPEWWQLAREVGWPAEEMPTVDRVMWCESNCQPTAYHSRYGASGLMQVLARWFPAGADPFDPATNLAKALEIREVQGWQAWSCW